MNGFKIIFAFFYDLLLLCALWFVATIPFLIWQGESFAQTPLMLLAFQIYLIAISYIYLTFFGRKMDRHLAYVPGNCSFNMKMAIY